MQKNPENSFETPGKRQTNKWRNGQMYGGYFIGPSLRVSDRCHSFSMHAKFSKKLTFLTPDTHTYVCIPGGKKCQLFGKFCLRTEWMIPRCNDLNNAVTNIGETFQGIFRVFLWGVGSKGVGKRGASLPVKQVSL